MRRPAGDNFKIIVEEEAAALGKSAVVDDFMSVTEPRSKGGSYDICVKNDCRVGYRYHRAEVGRVLIPHRIGRVIDSVGYVFGRFANGQLIPCEPKVACAGKTRPTPATALWLWRCSAPQSATHL